MTSVRIRQVETSRELGERGVLAVVVPVVAAAFVRLVAGVLVAVPESFAPLHWSSILAVTTVAAVAGTLAYALLDRFTVDTVRNFLALAAVTFVLLAVPIVTVAPDIPGARNTLIAVLFVLHVVVAVGIVVPLVRGIDALTGR